MFGMTISASQAKTLVDFINAEEANYIDCLLYTSPSPRDGP